MVEYVTKQYNRDNTIVSETEWHNLLNEDITAVNVRHHNYVDIAPSVYGDLKMYGFTFVNGHRYEVKKECVCV